ncbi:soluble starch synthase 3, chloroplastic/amyloplastic-like isoform X1 [Lotus japonicus]|uniref:soluble starch synthase 3, chloroplastic/amyloplastic-like isoform X1 n=1 Tax=Lotus japonicus TaxID=34305 RepID=UPI0025856561|nr:soluble starch synthase 3, chloroplastic/amyloplastic-like isoform X1 [Lotus japonicus]XP_057436289.1 soluble starch synthase 3, chloroplastic/amyloplastic-like isoform X1 [Lotus japonicus]
MEMSSLPLNLKTTFPDRGGGCLKLTPFSGFFLRHPVTTAAGYQSSGCKAGWGGFCVKASSADFSRRRQQKKVSIARPKDSAPKGFAPKSPVRASSKNTSKKKATVKKGDSLTPTVSEIPGDGNKQTLDVNTDNDNQGVTSNRGEEIGDVSTTDEDVIVLKSREGISYNGDVGIVNESEERTLDYAEIDENVQVKSEETSTASDDRISEEASRRLKLELEQNLRRQEIERIAEENLSQGTKMFVYPPVVKPDQDIEVYLNKSLSTLSDEPDILIMGAFNDWRWKSFTLRMNRTHLKGDWWFCELHVHKEAYKLDFVFFNGQDVYDNNDGKDFCIPVEGGMDALAFDDFLLEEKRKELVKLAKEQAERERQAEEQRRIEAEKAAEEADRSQARVEVETKRETLLPHVKKAVKSVDNVWCIEPTEFKGKDLVRLYYKGGSGPLAQAKEIWIHGGYNNWKDGLSIVERLVKSVLKGGDWWYADVVVPDRALVLDWVFADGPPQNAVVYDNNQLQDFHAIVPIAPLDEQYWAEEEQLIYRKLQEDRKLREETIRAKAAKTAKMKAETKEKTLKTFLLSQKHIVFTEPLDVQAGSIVTVFYNPSNTNLKGKPEVWFRCSFNRWSHRIGPLPPQRMLPADNGTHVKACVKVPLDAYMMDFVFSESESGGVFDNKFGMDYHIPVFGGIVKEPPLHITHIAVEMAPIAKVSYIPCILSQFHLHVSLQASFIAEAVMF